MEALLQDYGHLGIILFLVLTGCGLPLPEEVALIAAGILAADGKLAIGPAFLSCLIGCLLGDSIMYWIGNRVGRRIMASNSPWGKFLTPEREKLLEHLIHTHGAKVLLISRFLVGIRSPVYLTAGILKYPFRRFLLIDTLCASLVILLFSGVSYYFGPEIAAWIRKAEYGLTIVIVGAVLIGGFMLWRHLRHNKQATKPFTLERLLGETHETLEAAEHEPPVKTFEEQPRG